MSPYFSKSRNIELSTIYYFETQIAASWAGINVVKSFAQVSSVALPVVCIRLLDTISVKKEIGNTAFQNTHGIIIDIFAKSDGQRIDLADFILSKLETNWTYYIHSHTSGNPAVLDRVADGKVNLLSITVNRRIDFTENVEEQDRFRHVISFLVTKYD